MSETKATQTTYTTISETDGLPCVRLVRADGTDRYTVILVDYDRGQLYAAMPGDRPTGGGQWCARISDRGISYVASLYSESYARRIFKQMSV